MKYLYLIFFYITTAHSNVEKESEAFVSSLKAKDVEEQLINSPQMGECAKKAENLEADAKKDSIRKCFADELAKKSDDEIKKFSESIQLKDFDRKAAKSVTSIREYLSDRFNRAIHGQNYDKTKFGTKHKKFIGQTKFLDMYETQIGKNVIMEISKYCLENLRFDNKPIEVFCTNMQNKPYSGCTQVDPNDSNIESLLPLSKSSLNKFFGEEVTEVNFGDNGNTAKDLDQFAKEDFSRGGEYLKAKHMLCTTGIDKLCKRYECNNTITDPNNKDCLKLITGWKPNILSQNQKDSIKLENDRDSTGRIACNLVQNLKAYRKNLIAIQESKELIDKSQSSSKTGYNVSVAYKGIYQEGKGNDEKSINEITTISSKELTENDKIKELKDLDKKADDLTDKCKGSTINSLDDECKDYLISEDDLNNIEVEFEASTAIELKKIKALKDDDQALQQYLTENGLKIESTDPEELVNIISDKYKAQRLAVINQLRDEFENRKVRNDKNNPSVEEAQIQAQIQKASEEIKSKKDRLGTLIHYNNIVSSFLEIEDDKGEKSLNTSAFEVEKEGFDKFTKDESQKEQAEQYFSDLGDNVDTSSSTGSDGRLQLSIEGLEGIIGISKDKDKN